MDRRRFVFALFGATAASGALLAAAATPADAAPIEPDLDAVNSEWAQAGAGGSGGNVSEGGLGVRQRPSREPRRMGRRRRRRVRRSRRRTMRRQRR